MCPGLIPNPPIARTMRALNEESESLVTTTRAGQAGYHPLPPDLRCCNADAAQLLTDFFEAKNSHDVDATMQFIASDLSVYADVTLGWELNGYDALKDVWAQYMPTWGEGRLSDGNSWCRHQRRGQRCRALH
jgi:hypothetical protein